MSKSTFILVFGHNLFTVVIFSFSSWVKSVGIVNTQENKLVEWKVNKELLQSQVSKPLRTYDAISWF